jgi:hypothetical protein
MEIDICPRWILRRFNVPELKLDHVSILVSTLLALLLVPIVPHIPHFCLVQKVFGIVCPGCGISHSLMALLRLNMAESWQANPAGFGIAAVFSFQFLARPVAIVMPRASRVVSALSRYGSNVAVALLLVVWIYKI